MTVASAANKVTLNGNGATTSWPFSFRIFDSSDLEIYKTDTSGVQTEITSNFSVVVNGESGGTVTYPNTGSPLASGETITIIRVTVRAQSVDFTSQGAFLPQNHEDADDRAMMILQELDEKIDRAFKLPTSDTSGTATELTADVTGSAGGVLYIQSGVLKLSDSANIDGLETLAGISGDITTVATNISDVTAVSADLAGAGYIEDASDLLAITAPGIVAKDTGGYPISRTITGSTGISVSDGDGGAGDPTLTLDPVLVGIVNDTNFQGFVGAFTFPTTDGVSGQALTTDGLGTVSWVTPAGGGDTLKAVDEDITGNWDFEAGLNRSGQRIYDADYYDSLADALTDIGVLNARLYIGLTQTLTADTTIPSNVELCFGVRGRIVTDTYTLTINGSISSSTGRTRIFNTSGGGSVTGSPKCDYVYPEWFNADGSKSTEWDEMQEALDFASLADAELLVAKSHSLDEDITINSNQRIRGVTEVAAFTNTRLFISGSATTMKALTSAASKGDTTLQLDTSGLSAGNYLKVASCINSGSTDAGDDRLLGNSSEESYFSEFVKVESITNGTELELLSELIWDYSNTPGSDTADPLTDQSGGSRSSVAWRVLFNNNVIIQDMTISTIATGAGNDALIIGEFCKDTIIDNCILNTGDVTGWAAAFTYSYGCLIRDCTIIGKQTNIDTGSTDNPVFFRSSQNCFIQNSVIDGGNQGVDVITFGPDVGSGGHRGGPSIRCGARNISCRNQQTDLVTSHPGCYQSVFDGVQGTANSTGVRIRSREDLVTNCVISGGSVAQGRGVFASGGYTINAKVSNNIIRGLQRGVNVDPADATDWTLPVNVDITNNVITSSTFGVLLESPDAATNQFFGARVFGNKIIDCVNDGVVVQDYFNGAHVTNNYIAGVGASYAGITWEGNQSYLTVMDNFTEDVNASGYAREGNGAAAITDTVTFPGGEADAYWFIGNHYGDGSDTGISHGSTAIRAALRTTESQTFGNVVTANLTAADVTADSGTFGDGSNSVPVIADRSSSSGAVGYRFTNSQGSVTLVGDPTGSSAGDIYALFGTTVNFGTSANPWKGVYAINVFDQNGAQLLGDRVVDADLAAPNAITAYTAPTISLTYTQSEVQAIADALQTLRNEVADVRDKTAAGNGAITTHGIGATS